LNFGRVDSCSSPKDHWQKFYSTNGRERANGEIKRRTEVVGILPDEDAITGLVGAILSNRTTNGPCSAVDT